MVYKIIAKFEKFLAQNLKKKFRLHSFPRPIFAGGIQSENLRISKILVRAFAFIFLFAMISNMKIDLKHFKEKLEEEKAKLESELKTVGRINPANPNDWQATPTDMEADAADRVEVAESIDQFEENTAILKELEIQLNDVKRALKKITNGKYGLCEKDGKPIPAKRLEANPAARTCLEHAKSIS